ncbi:MAG: VOC family protein [Candidatus Aenigmarchaeota archaeon]|nr:VOC family protein [Candidatus Aenigmarchaeota archaeon]
MDKVVHFEIPADDVERAQKFYKTVFGWGIMNVAGMNYTLVTTTETGEDRMPKQSGAINGGMMKRSGPIKSPVITIGVADVSEAVKKIKSNGGKIIMDKFKVGDIGFSAYVEDTEGNLIGIWEDIKGG